MINCPIERAIYFRKGVIMTKQIISKYSIQFTQVPNKLLMDSRLSLRAKGLYAYLFSKPDGWQFFTGVLRQELHESQGQIRTAIRELIDAGYIIRHQFNENGCFGGIIYEFVDIDTVCTKTPCADFSAYGKTCTQNNIDNINNTDKEDDVDDDRATTATKTKKFWVRGRTDSECWAALQGCRKLTNKELVDMAQGGVYDIDLNGNPVWRFGEGLDREAAFRVLQERAREKKRAGGIDKPKSE